MINIEKLIEKVKNSEEAINVANDTVARIEEAYKEALEEQIYVPEGTELVYAEEMMNDFVQVIQDVTSIDLEDIVFSSDYVDDYELEGNIDDTQKLAAYILTQVVEYDLLENAYYGSDIIITVRDEDVKDMDSVIEKINDCLSDEELDDILDDDTINKDDLIKYCIREGICPDNKEAKLMIFKHEIEQCIATAETKLPFYETFDRVYDSINNLYSGSGSVIDGVEENDFLEYCDELNDTKSCSQIIQEIKDNEEIKKEVDNIVKRVNEKSKSIKRTVVDEDDIPEIRFYIVDEFDTLTEMIENIIDFDFDLILNDEERAWKFGAEPYVTFYGKGQVTLMLLCKLTNDETIQDLRYGENDEIVGY